MEVTIEAKRRLIDLLTGCEQYHLVNTAHSLHKLLKMRPHTHVDLGNRGSGQ